MKSPSYNDYVRRQYAGAEARRRLSVLRPGLYRDVVAFEKTGVVATKEAVIGFLKAVGTVGAVDEYAAEILAHQEDARAAAQEFAVT